MMNKRKEKENAIRWLFKLISFVVRGVRNFAVFWKQPTRHKSQCFSELRIVIIIITIHIIIIYVVRKSLWIKPCVHYVEFRLVVA